MPDLKPAGRLAVVTPVLNDWACLDELLADLDRQVGVDAQLEVTVFVVDDGSTDPWDGKSAYNLAHVKAVEVVRLGCNLGHQRAIATGLVEVRSRGTFDAVVVMDADGEDLPADILSLWRTHLDHPQDIVVAQRRERSENLQFKAFYGLYKSTFRLLTGRRLDFGNFSLLPASALQRIVLMPELWNHYPATLMRARIPLVRIPRDRGSRYRGQSRMNFTALVTHGLAAMAAFIDTVVSRLLVVVGFLVLLLALLTGVAIVTRLATDVPMPGWAALGASVTALSLVQVIAALIVVSFLSLAGRSTPIPPPSTIALAYVIRIDRIETYGGQHSD